MQDPLYVPYPDPTIPETMNQANIETLRKWGVIAVDAWASLEEYRRDAGSYDTWPTEGNGGKTWCNTTALAWGQTKRYFHLRLLRDDRGRPVRNPLNYSDEMFHYLPPNVPQCFRSRPQLFREVPLWRRVEYSPTEATRLNFSATPLEQIPIARFHDQVEGEVGEGNAFPSDVAFRFRPNSDVVEFFKVQPFLLANPLQTEPPPAPKRLPDQSLIAGVRDVLASGRSIADMASAIRRLAA